MFRVYDSDGNEYLDSQVLTDIYLLVICRYYLLGFIHIRTLGNLFMESLAADHRSHSMIAKSGFMTGGFTVISELFT